MYRLREAQEKWTRSLLKIKVHYYITPGQKLVMTGNTQFLGLWDPNKGLPMEYKGEGSWEAKVYISNLKQFEYKFVCVSQNGEFR